jgi:hypothetical protein
MDAAFTNAKARRSELEGEIATFTDQLKEATAELARVNNFLRDYAAFAGIEPPPGVPPAPVAAVADKPKRERPVNLPKEKVGDFVEGWLTEFNRPISRDRIFSLLEENGVHLQGTDPKMVLSTMLWRMKDRFQRVPGRGYWFVGKPIPPPERSMFPL